MLKLHYLFENYDLAELALKNWSHEQEGLADLLAQFRISSNAVYPFPMTGKETGILRLAPTGEKQWRNLIGELEFLFYLRNNGFPAMEPLPAKTTGEFLLELNTPWGGYYAMAYARVPGVRLDRTDFRDEIMLEYGKTLGRLHVLSARFTPRTPKWGYEDALDWAELVLAGFQDAPALNELSRVRAAMAGMEKTPKSYGLIHYDFEPDNVFYNEQTGLCHVIDFDDGMYCFYALDVDQALNAIGEEMGEGAAAETAKAMFLEGYRQANPCWREALAPLPGMRAFCEIYAYARLMHSLSDHVDPEPDWMSAIRAKCEATLQRTRQGFGT